MHALPMLYTGNFVTFRKQTRKVAPVVLMCVFVSNAITTKRNCIYIYTYPCIIRSLYILSQIPNLSYKRNNLLHCGVPDATLSRCIFRINIRIILYIKHIEMDRSDKWLSPPSTFLAYRLYRHQRLNRDTLHTHVATSLYCKHRARVVALVVDDHTLYTTP